MRVALQYAAVHKCARVTLVRITDNIFFIALGVFSKLPFHTGREAATTTTAQAGFFNLVHNLLRSHLRNSLSQCLITAYGDIFFNSFRVDSAAVSQYQAMLLFVEADFRITRNLLLIDGFTIEQTLYDASFI